MRREVRICDICDEPDAEEVTIIMQGTAWRADLCAGHRRPLDPILIHARESRLPVRGGGTYEKISMHTLMETVKKARGFDHAEISEARGSADATE